MLALYGVEKKVLFDAGIRLLLLVVPMVRWHERVHGEWQVGDSLLRPYVECRGR
jgi:hypothetical protein